MNWQLRNFRKRSIFSVFIPIIVLCTFHVGVTEAKRAISTAVELTSALRSNGLPIGRVVILDTRTDPNHLLGRPGQYTSKTLWADSRYPQVDPSNLPDNTIEVFPTVQSAIDRQRYVDAVIKGTPLLTQYIFREGRYVMRLQKEIVPDEAAQYEQALKQISQ
jgi:hypothetical protein